MKHEKIVCHLLMSVREKNMGHPIIHVVTVIIMTIATSPMMFYDAQAWLTADTFCVVS